MMMRGSFSQDADGLKTQRAVALLQLLGGKQPQILKMPGLQGEHVSSLGSPIKRNKLSLKFFQKKDTKRVLDFSEPQADEAKPVSCDQVVPAPSSRPGSPGLFLPPSEKRDNLVPFVGFSNGGNTCYLNSILQVLYHCPGLKEGIKSLYKLSKGNSKLGEEIKCEEHLEDAAEPSSPAHIELIGSFHSLITSVEQVQAKFLLSPESFSERELDTSPRKLLHTLRQLNPMYEGYLQHDAQEVLQCILGYIQEACITIRKEHKLEKQEDVDVTKVQVKNGTPLSSHNSELDRSTEDEGQVNGKRKSDTDLGNAKKKPKSIKSARSSAEEEHAVSAPVTRSKRKSSCDITQDNTHGKDGEEGKGDKEIKVKEEEDVGSDNEKTSNEADEKKKRSKLSWLRPVRKQPSIMSMFRTVGKLTSSFGKKVEQENNVTEDKQTKDDKSEDDQEVVPQNVNSVEKEAHQDGLDLLERLFQGQLVLRTRCLECESFTERREDFQDISVPVLDEQPSSPDDLSSVSPYPKLEQKTLKWSIAQFASVERIVGEDKYFCDTCHHYAEAERSLLFDKTPDVITIHLKRFSANNLELDPYAGLSKVNTPLQTPLTLSLEEWCTPRSSDKGHHYQLFAVVMHSGVSISSGHYTAYVRMSGLEDAKLWLQDGKETEEEEAKDYDDGEVSVKQNAKEQPAPSLACSKPGSKKLPEGGVGLLGGQRSSVGSVREAPKQRTTLNYNPEAGDGPLTSCEGLEASEQQALNNLLEYEGKWLLFDDSEVRLFQEEDVLQACSHQTCSSSTPYLLFYKRVHADTTPPSQ
nr:ubiquitin carboxyl-terminal hydrolase 1-like isoform X1 [Nerophis lumbriciformis]XP_061831695.1 ubiquitin carboxyl-terminal hydrolase 1-like isoform X1 [Nerophis lumbriciformis]XP_061831696.1 ubiquitin carboxyl-terminal hydrolase 1-like isoform X1 [Nerophis lumbriciformis]XP_061831697.1 ubiquitin carboxyl-terminal hydrolase 1-like isoform X1 [Nerophis lumbriciformis]XP_061831698.1 ubiquitin carboxyl-terminal hydrolase 1-like isoform X1 [Nerophis lumbriciformis]